MDYNISKTLYKKDTKGKIRFLTLSSKDGAICQSSGIIGGKSIDRSKMAKAKNIGKSNETSIEEQAKIEIEAKIVKKYKEGYFDTIVEAETTEVIKPMLAQVYEDRVDEITFDENNVYVQPKLDGMRCLEKEDGKFSRDGGIISNVNHIVFDRRGRKIIIDGELYVHGESFQTNMKYVKKYREGLTEKIQLWAYDIISNQPFVTRKTTLDSLSPDLINIKLVPTFKVNSISEIKKYHKQFLAEGYEGTMVRWGNEGYEQGKRSKHLLKFKDFHDLACEITDVLPSDADPEIGVVECKVPMPKGSDNSGIFRCGMKFSHEERKEILTNKHEYIGKMAEIRFFEFTDDGLPRFPIFHGVRLDK